MGIRTAADARLVSPPAIVVFRCRAAMVLQAFVKQCESLLGFRELETPRSSKHLLLYICMSSFLWVGAQRLPSGVAPVPLSPLPFF